MFSKSCKDLERYTKSNKGTMITCEEPKVSPTGRYNVMQTAEALGIHRNTLQKYTDSGFIRCRYRRNTRQKFYLGSEILRFWLAQS